MGLKVPGDAGKRRDALSRSWSRRRSPVRLRQPLPLSSAHAAERLARFGEGAPVCIAQGLANVHDIERGTGCDSKTKRMMKRGMMAKNPSYGRCAACRFLQRLITQAEHGVAF